MTDSNSEKPANLNFEDSFDQDLADLLALEERIQAHYEHIDNLFEHLEILENIRSALNSFERRLRDVERLLTAVNWDMGSFLYGHMYCATVGAYECLMHAVIDALVNSNAFSKSALTYLANQKSDLPGTINLGLKKRPIRTREEARERLRRATLIDAERIANTIKRLFDLDLPVPIDSKRVARLRNLFAHNGGVDVDGSVEPMSKDRVLDLVHQLDELVADTTTRIGDSIANLGERSDNN
jgi:hypothetical protein